MCDRPAAARAVPPGLKRVVKIEGARHYGAISFDAEAYTRAVREFARTAGGAAPLAGSAAAVR